MNTNHNELTEGIQPEQSDVFGFDWDFSDSDWLTDDTDTWSAGAGGVETPMSYLWFSLFDFPIF